jgi:hypothetical protein
VKKTVTTDHILLYLETLVRTSTLRAAAAKIGISTAYLHDVINRRRHVSEPLAAKLGYEQEIRWKRIGEGK